MTNFWLNEMYVTFKGKNEKISVFTNILEQQENCEKIRAFLTLEKSNKTCLLFKNYETVEAFNMIAKEIALKCGGYRKFILTDYMLESAKENIQKYGCYTLFTTFETLQQDLEGATYATNKNFDIIEVKRLKLV